jgi:hypothetical protein
MARPQVDPLLSELEARMAAQHLRGQWQVDPNRPHPQSIPADEIAHITSSTRGTDAHAAASWRYYSSLVGEET